MVHKYNKYMAILQYTAGPRLQSSLLSFCVASTGCAAEKKRKITALMMFTRATQPNTTVHESYLGGGRGGGGVCVSGVGRAIQSVHHAQKFSTRRLFVLIFLTCAFQKRTRRGRCGSAVRLNS